MEHQDTRRIYEQAGIGTRVTRGERPGILVVDFAYGFTRPQYATGADLSLAVASTRRLLDLARDRGLPIWFTTIAYAPSLRDAGVWLQKMPGMSSLVVGTPQVEIDDQLAVRDEEPVIVKKGPSAFFGTNLAPLMTAERIDTLIVCGATTSGCVRASVIDSVQHGFPTLIIADCVGDRADVPHETNLFDMDAKYGDVITLDDALGYLSGLNTLAGWPRPRHDVHRP